MNFVQVLAVISMPLSLVIFVMYLTIFGLGTWLGSFINKAVYRIPLGLPLLRGRSFCPHCGKPIPFYLRIPALSYFWLRGQCARCQEPIAWRYPAVELFTGLLAVILVYYYNYDFTWDMLWIFAVSCTLLTIALIDHDHCIIPNSLVALLVVLAWVRFYWIPEFDGLSYLVGVIAVSGPMIFFHVAFHGFGLGDVKVAVAAGMLLGFPKVLLAIFVALMTGSLGAIYRLVNQYEETYMPFGPYLSLGIFVALIAGDQIISAYLGLIR